MNEQSSAIFNNSWNLYKKIVDLDLMNHRDFGVRTKNILLEHAAFDTVSILDIGCGDAATLSDLLLGISIEHYTGYDLSSTALEQAAQSLETLNVSFSLHEGDMHELIEKELQKFSVVYSSFAIHHLPDEKKVTLLQRVYEILKPGGSFVYIDIFRQPDQSLQDYTDAYHTLMKNDWVDFSLEEIDRIYQHISSCDFPMLLQDFMNSSNTIGFKNTELLATDGRHYMFHLVK